MLGRTEVINILSDFGIGAWTLSITDLDIYNFRVTIITCLKRMTTVKVICVKGCCLVPTKEDPNTGFREDGIHVQVRS